MKKSVLAFLPVFVLCGCDRPLGQVGERASAQEFAIHYDKVRNECKRIVVGDDTTYSCKNPADTTTIYSYHSRKSTLGQSGQNSGGHAVWDNNQKFYNWEAPFQVY